MSRPSPDLDVAVEALRAGGLVAFPTETVYGLGADATSRAAVRHLYAVKGRPAGHPVIAHVADVATLERLASELTEAARRLAAAFWPGPLTLVVRRRPGAVVDEVTGGRDTVAVRVPRHELALALLRRFRRPIAAPSANRFGRVSPTTADDVRADLGDDVDVVLDGGPTTVGVESTIVDVTGSEPVVLRVGGVPEEEVARVIGHRPGRRTRGEVAAPGTLPTHYAPAARVEVVDAADLAARVAARQAAGERVGVLGVGVEAPPGARLLAAPGSVEELARVLYAALRRADREGLDVVVAVEPEEVGLGAAVADRLRRAAGR